MKFAAFNRRANIQGLAGLALGVHGLACSDGDAGSPTALDVMAAGEPALPAAGAGGAMAATNQEVAEGGSAGTSPMLQGTSGGAGTAGGQANAYMLEEPLMLEGFGAGTTGGEGGEIIVVDDVAALREAVGRTGTRIIRFGGGGVLDFNGGSLNITSGGVTIDGSTAQQPVTLREVQLNVSASNVILQHLRIRGSGINADPTSIDGGSRSVVFDHCSISWSGDDSLGSAKSGSIENVTIQWTLVAEPLNCQVSADKNCGQNFQSFRTTWRNTSVHHNLFLTGTKGVMPSSEGPIEYVNNVFSNFAQAPTSANNMDVIGNIFEPRAGGMVELSGNGYVKDNVGTADMGQSELADTALTIVPVDSLKAVLAEHVGATLPCRDRIDAQFVRQMLDGVSDPAPESLPERWGDAQCDE